MIEQLTEHRLLQPLSAAEREAVVALCEERRIPAGTVLMRQGAAARGLSLLLEGRVEVVVHAGGRDHEVAVLGPDTVVGELSMLRGGHQSGADVRALTDVRAAFVPLAAADDLLEVDALVLQLDAIARVRRATNRALDVAPVPAGTVDGQVLQLRPLWPEDWRQLASGIERFSETSLRRRFFHLPRFTEQTLRRLTMTNHHDQFAWGAFLAGANVGVGRHALQAEDRRTAEVAFIVADELHGRGLGSRLVAATAVAAEVHGATELYALALADNVGIKELLRRHGASWQRGGDPSTVEARWPVADAVAAASDEAMVAAAREVATVVLGDVLDG